MWCCSSVWLVRYGIRQLFVQVLLSAPSKCVEKCLEGSFPQPWGDAAMYRYRHAVNAQVTWTFLFLHQSARVNWVGSTNCFVTDGRRIKGHGTCYSMSWLMVPVLVLPAALAVVCTQRPPGWSGLVHTRWNGDSGWVRVWCLVLLHCGTARGIDPNSRVGDGQGLGKPEQMEEGRTKANEDKGDKVSLGQRKHTWKLRECGCCCHLILSFVATLFPT